MKARSNTQPQGAIGTARAGEAGGELVEVGLAERHRAGREQAGDDRGVLVRRIGEGWAGGGGRDAGEVEVVLDRERDAGQRQVLAGRHPRVHRRAPAPARRRRRSGRSRSAAGSRHRLWRAPDGPRRCSRPNAAWRAPPRRSRVTLGHSTRCRQLGERAAVIEQRRPAEACSMRTARADDDVVVAGHVGLLEPQSMNTRRGVQLRRAAFAAAP